MRGRVLVLLLLSGCIDKHRPKATARPDDPPNACTLRGTFPVGGVMLAAGPTADAPRYVAVVSFSELAVDVSRVQAGAPRAIYVTVHTPTEGNGLRVWGWLADTDLSFRAAPQVTPQRLTALGPRARVRSMDGGAPESEVDCTALTIGPAVTERAPRELGAMDARWIQRRTATAAVLRAEPRLEAPTIGEVDATASLFIRDQGDGWSQVLPASRTLRRMDERADLPDGQAMGFWARTADVASKD